MSSSSTMANARLPPEGDPIAQADALVAQGRAAEAVALLQRWHDAGRGGLLLQAARVRALLAADDAPGAIAVARDAAALHPGVAEAALALGDALLAGHHLAVAIGEYQRALRLDPGSVPARYRLGCAWLAAGEAEKAEAEFASIPDLAAPPELAARRAEIAAMRARPRSDPRYVRHLFDQFSSDYDARMLGQLDYGAPGILRALADLTGIVAPRRILDLGCGTGLCGAAFRDLARRLDGIDLSPAMIEKARARGIYDTLQVADLETALDGIAGAYDLLLAADTLVYLGDLAAVFAGAAKTLPRGGMFLFTVERQDGQGFALGPKRRWRHSEHYLRAQADMAGFAIAGLLECQPRSEAGVPVDGYAVALEAPR